MRQAGDKKSACGDILRQTGIVGVEGTDRGQSMKLLHGNRDTRSDHLHFSVFANLDDGENFSPSFPSGLGKRGKLLFLEGASNGLG